MAGFSDTLSITASALRAQAMRLRLTSENVANADTPGYRRKTVPFREAHGRGAVPGSVETGPVRLDRTAFARIHDPSSPLADETGHYDGSNVNLLYEIADAREASRSYEANLKLFEQTRRMSGALLDLLRR
ncbi:flagellar basal body rod protein FlgC [Wenxinia saemankumensis]|uniref:Flagellar basal-body rod protein FlgC n=1 Tax=Wenxinia saemankumensis TaxID=1447782 RepID=A0A1M6G5V0_9RHOB|nr:flagellar basal body rod protein FlgC [Wenxinia saemankumensis]SHJ05332.1 flagellar basal-body rod protein FlgC [Wenxinia saemankumensis]